MRAGKGMGTLRGRGEPWGQEEWGQRESPGEERRSPSGGRSPGGWQEHRMGGEMVFIALGVSLMWRKMEPLEVVPPGILEDPSQLVLSLWSSCT